MNFRYGIIIFISVISYNCSAPSFSFKQTDCNSDTPLIHTNTILLAADINAKRRSKTGRFFFGEHYRAVWRAPVRTETFNSDSLTPVKIGGSRETLNLRMRDKEGKEYVLRSLKKYPTRALPGILQKTFASRIAQDFSYAGHPYAPLIISRLAHEAELYHTNPQIAYIPCNIDLNSFSHHFRGILVLFEERPDDNWKNAAFFGYSEDIESTRRMLGKLFEDNDNVVDVNSFARARLFDMWIGDWSRHEDQWRWASFEKDKSTLFKPIPRDRDHTFYKISDGLIKRLISFVRPNYQHFGYKFKNADGLNRAGRRLDETFLWQLDQDEWLSIANDLKNKMTDEIIEGALKLLPDTIYQLSAEEIKEKLISRRSELDKVAIQYHRLLMQKVRIPGTDKHERFDVVVNDTSCTITLYKTSRKGNIKKTLKEKTFFYSNTNQITLYGLGGKDQFDISGETSKIKIKVYGGAGEDIYKVKGDLKKLKIIDMGEESTLKYNAAKYFKNDPSPVLKNFDAKGWLLRYKLD